VRTRESAPLSEKDDVKLGLILANQYPLGESMARRIDEVVEQVDLMRELGYDLLVLGQHHLATPYQQPSSVPFLARLAANSSGLRLGITVFLLPLHNPVDIAEQVATLDAISHGRMIFGAGLGYRPEEYEAFGIPVQERVPRFVEALDLITRLWTQDELEFNGRFYSVPRVQSTIRPIQQPHPPIWLAANQLNAVRRAARMGYPWIMNPHATVSLLKEQMQHYRDALREHGHPPPAELPLLREAWVADTRERAWAEAAPYLAHKYSVYTAWGQDRVLPSDQSFERPLEGLARDRFIIGTADDLIAETARIRTELGVTTLILRIQWPGMDHQRVLDEIRTIGQAVLPRLADAQPGV
jgi:alkanesulfonate monooxygenase SsuD/methylene tetrahydromethanopterin reductase-like flavin-dependent oxidoreductase (luciferase family)